MDKDTVVNEETNSKDNEKIQKEATMQNTSEENEKLKMYAVTWNLHGEAARLQDIEVLIPKNNFYHLYVIGTEECMRSIFSSIFYSDKSEWESLLQGYLGEEYHRIRSETLSAIHIILFAHKTISNEIKDIRSNSLKNGFYGTLGNKGAVGISFKLYNHSILLINSHLAAGQSYVSKRNDDFLKINTTFEIDENAQKVFLQSVSDGYDICLWLGDFNYRINLTLNEIRGFLFSQRKILESIPHLLNFDQMKIEKEKGSLFINKFKEAKITFPPTYKLIVGTDDYVLEEGGDRIPGWTDRILYINDNYRFKSKINEILEIKEYNSILKIVSSDHKPVYAIFELDLLRNRRKSEEILDR